MPRGDRRPLVRFDLAPPGTGLEARVHADATSGAGVAERLLARKTSAPWCSLPSATRDSDLSNLRDLAQELQANSDAILVLGPAGLELGARALARATAPPSSREVGRLEFVLGDWSGTGRLGELVGSLGPRRVSLVVLMGPEPGPEVLACLRVLHAHVAKRHGTAEATRRIVFASHGGGGFPQEVSRERGFRLLEPPHPVPEAYSALTPAGLLVASLAGTDPALLVEGARSMARSMEGHPPAELPCVQYASARLLLAEEGRRVEFMATGGTPAAALLPELARLLTLPHLGARRAPLPVPWRPSDPSTTGLAREAEGAFGTWIHLPAPEGPSIPEDTLGDGWEGLAGQAFGSLEERLWEARRETWSLAGMPSLGLQVPRLDVLHLGALVQFFHCVRGLSAAWHAPDADLEKAPPSGRGTLAPTPPARPAAGAV